MTAHLAPAAPAVPGYAVGERLGGGGAGTVWAATRTSDGAPVALKVVVVGTTEQAESLAREFAVLARVGVEGLVGFHEAVGLVGEPPAVALVLDQVGGGSLESIVSARGHLSVGESVTILAPVARALAGLHGLGVVHGDVTPANVLIERTGQPLLADLGVASLVGEVPGQLYGTAGFVAPEVLDRGVLTTASDAYAVGALAWWCVTGEPPAPVALRRPLDELAPGLPTAWSETTRQALLGDPDARPTAAELALAYFDSAPCEPLRLVVGSDETSLLTQRLRQPGVVATPGLPPGHPGAGTALREGVRCAVGWTSGRLRRMAGGLPSRAAMRVRGVRDVRVGRAATFGTAALVVVGLTVFGLVAGGQLAGPGGVHPPRDGLVRVATPATSHRDAARPDAATERAAPQRDPRALMVALSALRAEVMTSGSLTALARLDVPGSAAIVQDSAVLAELADSGRSWEGVALGVTSARTVTCTEAEATVEAVVQTAAYRVVDGVGHTLHRPAVPGQPLRFELAWVAGRWRVASITSATHAGG